MTSVLKLLSYAGLALSIVPAFFLAAGGIDRETYLRCMTLGMILWFATSPFWVKAPKPGE